MVTYKHSALHAHLLELFRYRKSHFFYYRAIRQCPSLSQPPRQIGFFPVFYCMHFQTSGFHVWRSTRLDKPRVWLMVRGKRRKQNFVSLVGSRFISQIRAFVFKLWNVTIITRGYFPRFFKTECFFSFRHLILLEQLLRRCWRFPRAGRAAITVFSTNSSNITFRLFRNPLP